MPSGAKWVNLWLTSNTARLSIVGNAATSLIFVAEDVPLAEFVYLVFSHTAGEEYHWGFRSFYCVHVVCLLSTW